MMSEDPPNGGPSDEETEGTRATGPLTPNRRARFENLGEDIVRQDMAQGGFRHIGGTLENREAARIWLGELREERERAQEVREQERREIETSALHWQKVAAIGTWVQNLLIIGKWFVAPAIGLYFVYLIVDRIFPN